MKEKKIRKIFLEELPHKGEYIDWINSIGYKIPFIYDNIEGWIEVVDYIKEDHPKLKIKYNYEEIEMPTDSVKNCNIGIILGKFTSEFKIEIGTRFQDEKRDLTITSKKKIGKYKYYKYTCNNCGFEGNKHYYSKDKIYKDEYWILENHLLNNRSGCACCCNSPRIVVQGINDIPTTNPEMVCYFQGGYDEAKMYTKGSNELIYPICPNCGSKKPKKMIINNIYKTHSVGCSCSDGISYPNKFMFNLLEQLDIDFINEYSPEWIGRRLYDFYFKLNDKEYIIEMDGSIGHGNGKYSKSKITKEESKAIDDYKDEQAKLHGIEVIRIDCDYESNDRFKFIKNNITDNVTLNEIFDSIKIDWNKCNEYACNNLTKIACDYKKNNPNMTTGDIGKIIGCTFGTIGRWLKAGNDLNWCNYDADEETRKTGSRNGKLKGKPVEIFKDDKSLGIFESAHELDRQSEELFGKKLLYGCISAVCRGKKPHYKGYTFKYVV